jgi:signal transduction histidine kinase
MALDTRRLMLGLGLVTWAAALAPAIGQLLRRGATLADVPWLVSACLFLSLFLLAVAPRRRVARGWYCAAQSAAALACASHLLAPGMLLAVVAAEVGFFLPLRAAFGWVVAQTLGLAAIIDAQHGLDAALRTGGIAIVVQGAMVVIAVVAQRERALRSDLARVNAEVLASRELLADGTRMAERLRIARELHDSLGHKLTALRLQLELASHLTSGRAAEPIERSSGLAKDLLTELRDVVGTMRQDHPLDLARAAALLTAGIPKPHIHLMLPGAPQVREPLVAHALFRCIQEALTNTIRHADATNLWIELEWARGHHVLTMRDDGRGAQRVLEGHGLRGARERVARLGGSLELDTRPGGGFRIRITAPALDGEGIAPEALDFVASAAQGAGAAQSR